MFFENFPKDRLPKIERFQCDGDAANVRNREAGLGEIYLCLALTHPSEKNATHGFDDALSELVRFAPIIIDPPIRLIQRPNAD